MKKLFLILPIIIGTLFSGSLNAQYYYSDYSTGEPVFYYFRYYGMNDSQDSLIKLHNIEAQKTYSLNDKGEKVFSGIKLYDEKYPKFDLSFRTKKKITYSTTTSTENFTVYDWKHWGSSSKQVTRFEKLNGKKFPKERIYFSGNKIYSRTQYFRNDTGRIDSTLFFRKRNTQPYSRTYYLYKNNKLAETKYYKKGKLKYVRKYDCTPLGEKVKKVKKTAVCSNTEFDKDGNKIVVNEFTNEKGKTTKTKRTFKGNSNVLIKRESFDGDNNSTFFFEKTDSKITQINYRRKGKESYKLVQHLDQKGNVIKQERFHKTKLKSTVLYEFNDQNFKTKEIYFNKKRELTKETTIEYDKRNLIIKKTIKGEKDTFTQIFEYL